MGKSSELLSFPILFVYGRKWKTIPAKVSSHTIPAMLIIIYTNLKKLFPPKKNYSFSWMGIFLGSVYEETITVYSNHLKH